jgi:hypothetical protein
VANSLQRRGLLRGAATLALLATHPMAMEGKKGNKKRGKKGGKGFSKLRAGTPDTFDVAESAEETGTSPCPSKSRAISGSYFLANPACQVVTSGPKDTDLSAWEVRISCPEGESSEINQVIALCIS